MRRLLQLIVFGCLPGCGMVCEARQAAQEEAGPRALLRKYEWFKDAAAKLDAMTANIEVQAGRRDGMERRYTGVEPKDWHRSDVERLAVVEAELAGLKAAFNGLAADYNARMVKANYAFTNAGELPAGESRVLPREYRVYITK